MRMTNLQTSNLRNFVAYTYTVAQSAQELQQQMAQPFDQNVHVDPQKWQQAKDTNPDPNTCYPVPLFGPQKLEERVLLQEKTIAAHKSQLETLEKEFSNQKSCILTHSMNKLEECKQRHIQIQRMLVKIMSQLEHHAVVSGAARQDYQKEAVLVQAYDELQQDLNRPSQFQSRLGDMSYQLRQLLHALENREGKTQNLVGDGDVQRILQVLDQQGEFLQQVQNEIRSTGQDVNQMEAVLRKTHQAQVGYRS